MYLNVFEVKMYKQKCLRKKFRIIHIHSDITSEEHGELVNSVLWN